MSRQKTYISKLVLNNEQLTLVENAIVDTFEQGERSVSSLDVCAYRGEGGLKCLVGHMIPDAEWDASELKQSVGVRKVIQEIPTMNKLFTNPDNYWLQALQECHDDAVGSYGFKKDLVDNLRRYYAEGKLPKQLGNIINELTYRLEKENVKG